MGGQVTIEGILVGASAATVLFASAIVWLDARFFSASAEMIKASTESTKLIATTVDKVEALVLKLRTEESRKNQHY